jgi:type IV pilus assembly protein PilW
MAGPGYLLPPYRTRSQFGLSLVELLISIVLALLLTNGMVAAYLESKRNYLYDEQQARLQENGRYAMTLLKREFAMAGFFGTALSTVDLVPEAVATDCSDNNWALDASTSLDLVNNYAGEAALTTVGDVVFTCLDGADIQPDTDLVAIKRTAGAPSFRDGIPATGFTASTGEQWYLRMTDYVEPGWQKLRPLDLYDFGGTGSPLAFWEASAKIFYIRRYSDSTDLSDPVPTLCAETLVGQHMGTRCLVEGVENIQFELGTDSDGDGVANRYVAAPLKAELRRAVSVRIHLLLRSIQPIPGYRDDRVYHLGQELVAAPQDAFLRRVFSTTVNLRNQRLPLG